MSTCSGVCEEILADKNAEGVDVVPPVEGGCEVCGEPMAIALSQEKVQDILEYATYPINDDVLNAYYVLDIIQKICLGRD